MDRRQRVKFLDVLRTNYEQTTCKAHFCHSNLEVPMVIVATTYIHTLTSGMGFSAALLGLGPFLRGKCIEILE